MHFDEQTVMTEFQDFTEKWPHRDILPHHPSREHIGNIDDSIMLSSKRQACSLKRQRCDIHATLMNHQCYQCVLNWGTQCVPVRIIFYL